MLEGHDKLRSTEALHHLRARWETTYGTWSAQQFATALEDHGIKVKKRSVEGQPGQRVILAADITAERHTWIPESGHCPTGPS